MRDLVEHSCTSPSDELGRQIVGCIGGLKFNNEMASIARIVESLNALYSQGESSSNMVDPLASLLTLINCLDQVKIFKQDFCDYMDAILDEQELLAHGNIPHAGEYSALCVNSAHVPPMLRLAL